ncbi:Retrovirus-related Pol polyprotein from transposon RE1 [Vitis vinifera]|uniref:Retrovirus-related Pol polyprotein from transposon RE1 n=1 Tax=Vitis vinifera TaxID=29760 RepID=A0A438KR54_VITVI|nr:Retrovirus-related Pol polyprotein from transposon RE1 [Vitis vinifera]
MTSDTEGVNQPAVYSGNECVMVGNGQSLAISHTGSISSLVPSSPLLLSNVLVVPEIKKNLISISQLTKDNNCCVTFSSSGFTIQDRVTRVVLGVGRCENGLYVLDRRHHALVSTTSSPRASVRLWHTRLGHPHYRTVASLSKLGSISCSNKLVNNDSEICVGCRLGKSHRLPFSLNNERCAMPFDRLHCDLWGPSPVSSFNGYRYYAVFIDDCTRFSWIFPLKHKSDLFDNFINLQRFIETQFSAKIKSFQCDGGTKFTNNKFCSHLHSCGIDLRLACPYTPSQNGIAERKHRHVTETSLTLMFHARVPLPYGLRLSLLPSFSLTDSRHHLLLAKHLMSSCLECVSSSSNVSTSDSLSSPSFSNSLCLPCNDIPHLSSTSSPGPQVPLDEDSLLDSIATDSTTPSPVSSSPRVTTSSHPMITRGKAGIFKPRLYNAMHISSSSQLFQALLALKEPRSFKSAAKHPEWLSAMDDEIHTLKKNDTWVLARLVAQGFSQVHGLDFGDTFSPVVHPAIVRIILSLAVTSGWRLHQLDVKNAFLHGFLNEEVYMEQPPGYTDPHFPQHVCRLKRALYGLKQAPRAWFHRFSSFLLKLGFHSSQADSSLFVYHSSLGTVYLLLYVDDMIITRSTPSLVHTFITRLSNEFSMKDLGDLHYFLGVEVQANEKGLFLNQTKYALDLLQRASMIDAKPISTPFVVGQHLSAEGTLFSNPTLFRSLAGALQYLTITRPDLSFSVNSICQFMHAPTEDHFRALKRILRYVKGIAHHGLQLHKQSTRDLLGYSDADWAGCPDTRRSTTGYAIFFGANLISWSSKKQSTVSHSSAEAEYRSLAIATADIAWII